MTTPLKELLEIILLQEEKCRFDSFTSQDALDLGLLLIENAKPFKRPVVVDITLNGHQLFHYAMQGTNKDNDEWVRRKRYEPYLLKKKAYTDIYYSVTRSIDSAIPATM
jgi:uncharacterized protein (UPF0303 family)